MEKLFEKIGKPVRTEPLVWIRRMVIFKSCEPDKPRGVIQDITLYKGLNIVLAEDVSSTDGAELAGHGAGKTTFCRFIRYLLGEQTYSKEDDTKAIQKIFPAGYIAGEVFVDGQLWAVARPFKHAGVLRSFTRKDATIEQLFDSEENEKITFDKYIAAIELATIHSTESSGTVFRTDTEIRWDHILAWCSRDQETRYQKLGVWRSPKSQSQTPVLAAEEDGLFVMRNILGLFQREELEIEEQLAKDFRRQNALDEEIREAKKEPDYLYNKYTSEFCEQIGKSIKEIPPLESDTPLVPESSLKGLAAAKKQELNVQIEKLTIEIEKNRQQRDGIKEKVTWYEIFLKQAQNYKEVDMKAINELDTETLNRINSRKAVADLDPDERCAYGNVSFGECEYIGRLQFGGHYDNKNDEEQKKQRKIVVDQYNKQIAETVKLMIAANMTIAELDNQHKEVIISILNIRRQQSSLEKILENACKYDSIRNGKAKNTTLSELQGELNKLNTAINSQAKQLEELIAQHTDNLDLFTSLFDATVKSVLTSDYVGRVDLSSRRLNFQIRHGKARTSEAIDTLAILLADICSMLYSTYDKGKMPGFVIHDSPREADLSIIIYHSMIRFIMKLQLQLQKNCPFQYIMTTTTEPPDDLKDGNYIVLHLNASQDGKQLLKQNISEIETMLI